MVQIVQFPGRHGSTSTGDFLQDGGDTLSFDGAGADIRLPALEAAPQNRQVRDWSNQELADLFRVKRLLDAAGVPNEVDRGLTDEGEPWFVFCKLDGDVFIHMCRMDGAYLLDSPNIRTPLRGRNFNDLIADFTGRALDNDPATEDRRVIRLERGGAVFLHPSALLAALVWTLFIASDELVLLAPGEDAAATPDADGTAATLSGLPVEIAARAGLTNEADSDLLRPTAAGLETDALTHRDGQGGSQGSMIFGQNSYALGLSAVAIGMGVMSDSAFTDLRLGDAGLGDLLARLFDGDPDRPAGPDGDDATQLAASGPGQMLMQALDDVIDLLLNTQADDAERMIAAMTEADAPDMTAMLDTRGFADSLKSAGPDDMIADIPESGATPRMAKTALPDWAEPAAPRTTDPAPTRQDAKVDTAASEKAETVDLPAPAPTLTIADIRKIFSLELKEFSLGGQTVQASFEVTEDLLTDYGLVGSTTGTGTDSTASNGPDTLAGTDTAALPASGSPGDTMIDYPAFVNSEFSIQARDLFLHLLADAQDADLVFAGNSIMLLDNDALNSAAGETMKMDWLSGDGKVISIIGFRSDFEDFHLIA
ncbi:hypothetical protein [Pseudooceanicola aestuarii]|uniref:hypothetical protein n=1 Tax=Pseudooceanicola aestuarii TaxID=2697319 RepID=UPI0013D44018|nr:hypothetical protein [Pseudooceanicola aestuarii]